MRGIAPRKRRKSATKDPGLVYGTKKTCLLLTSAKTKTSDVWKVIANVLKVFDVKSLDVERAFYGSESASEGILKLLKKVDFVVADISERNPNVMYELGMCYAMGKPMILVARRSNVAVPFDVSAVRTVFYDETSEGLENLRLRLRKNLSYLFKPRTKVIFRSTAKKLKPKVREEEFSDNIREILQLDSTSLEAGRTFEILVEKILRGAGFEIMSAEKRMGEWPVDIVAWGPQGFLSHVRGPILVEAKACDLSQKDIDLFIKLLDSRHLNTGLIITSSSLGDEVRKHIADESRRRGISVVVLDKKELASVIGSKRFIDLLKRKITESILSIRSA